MADIHLIDILETLSQKEVAVIMGVTQGAVSQAYLAGRDIYFRPDGNGSYTHYEIKKPRQKKAA